MARVAVVVVVLVGGATAAVRAADRVLVGRRTSDGATTAVVGTEGEQVREAFEQRIDLGHDLETLATTLAVLEEGPELLQTVDVLAVLPVAQRLILELLEERRTELFLQTVRVEAEETLETVAVVTLVSIFAGQLTEFIIHSSIELITQEMRPEAEESVHLARAAKTHLAALFETGRAVLLVLGLSEAGVAQQRMRRMRELGQVTASEAAW
mmetsp:Transcript_7812/g.24111  ORF Transcript_7812/g.24111 Transcript_7812/m.24111 type:complete len:211 (+) Transcript_7812:433-1065(+)